MSAIYNTGSRAEAVRLLAEAEGMKDGPEKIAVLEEAVRHADSTGDLRFQYAAREEFVEAAYFGGAPDRAIVAYTWCLAQFDRNPGEFDEWRLLWRYKWMVNVIADFPQIPLGQIYGMLEDMERRFRRGGYGLRSIYQYRYRIARLTGDREEAIRNYRRSQAERTDEVSDCHACRIDEQSSFHIYTGDDAWALEVARPLIEMRQFCRTVPERTFARLLVPLLRLGRPEEAADFHRRGYRLSEARSHGSIEYVSDHIAYLALAGEAGRAVELLGKNYRWSESNHNPHDHFLFYRAAWLALDLLAGEGETAVAVRMPPAFPLRDEGGIYETARLRDWFAARTLELARKFDERNGNDHFTRELSDLDALKRSAEPQ
ncbi:MAG TPA: hypothetical protein VK421_03070 [Pyrinomonadaceae bacterium]|nr:hypothetical protein [Pyrinomonadaceae bacterium]